MKLSFPNRSETAPELAVACRDLVDQLRAAITAVTDVEIGTTETAFRHGLTHVPAIVVPSPQGNVAVWRSTAPDESFCYYTAASAVVVDFLVIA